MKIVGLQKLTLLDYPEKVASTIFLYGCNLHCLFCHNSDLIDNIDALNVIDEKYVLDYLKEKVGKIEGVAITGGEPLINNDIAYFLDKIKNLGYKIKVDTNGFYPDNLQLILDKELVDMVAMDIKSGLTNYYNICGISKELNKNFIFKKSIDILLNCSIDYEFRTTCVKGLHTDNDFYEIRDLIKGAKNYYLQNYSSNDKLKNLAFKPFEKDELLNFVNIVSDYVDNINIRGL